MSNVNNIDKLNSQINKISSKYDQSALNQISAFFQKLNEVPIPRIDTTTTLNQISASFQRISEIPIPRIDTTTTLNQISASFQRISEVAIPMIDTTTTLNQLSASFQKLSVVGRAYDTTITSQAKLLAHSLKGITGAFQNYNLNFVLSEVGGNLEELTLVEDNNVTEDYFNELLDYLLELYSSLQTLLQKVWKVITTDNAKNIYTVLSLIIGLIIGLISFISSFKGDELPDIHIHNYSDKVDIDSKTDGNKIDIYIDEIETQKEIDNSN